MNAMLVMFKANGQRRDFPIGKPSVVIGRKQGCDLRIPLSSVSRQHCKIEVRGRTLVVTDLGSSNGTFHNDARVQETRLSAGDTLTIGPVHFIVVIDGQPKRIEPIKTILPSEQDDGVALSPVAPTQPKTIRKGASADDGAEAPTIAAAGAAAGAAAADGEDPVAALEALARKSGGSSNDALDALSKLEDDDIVSMLKDDDDEDD